MQQSSKFKNHSLSNKYIFTLYINMVERSFQVCAKSLTTNALVTTECVTVHKFVKYLYKTETETNFVNKEAEKVINRDKHALEDRKRHTKRI